MNVAATFCLADEALQSLLAADDHDPRADWMTHLAECPECLRRLERLAAADLAREALAEPLRGEKQRPGAISPRLSEVMHSLKARDPFDTGEAPSPSGCDLPSAFFQRDASRPEQRYGRVGDYDVDGELGRGAMGVVLRAFDAKLHRVVALKVLAPHLAAYPLARQRFVREGHSAAAVCHENVVAIYAVAESAGLPYLVMQYVPGRTLQQRIDEGTPRSVAEILRIGLQTASGLAAAHAQGLVHRDIKPANLLLENGVQRVKITDFGLARAVDDASLTQTGIVAGTPQYMAPEQARGEFVDHRADLFSLGCVLYALCVGRPPFRGSHSVAVLQRVCHDSPRRIRELNPDVPEWLEAIVSRLLEKRPEDRFATAEQLATLLAACLAHVQQPLARPLPDELASLTPAPAPRSESIEAAAPESPESRRRRFLATPRGLLVLLVAALAPLALVAIDRAVDRWSGPVAAPATLDVSPSSANARKTASESTSPDAARLPSDLSDESAAAAPSDARPATTTRRESSAQFDALDLELRSAEAKYQAGVIPLQSLLAVRAEALRLRMAHCEARGDRPGALAARRELATTLERLLEAYRPLREGGKVTEREVLATELLLLETRRDLPVDATH